MVMSYNLEIAFSLLISCRVIIPTGFFMRLVNKYRPRFEAQPQFPVYTLFHVFLLFNERCKTQNNILPDPCRECLHYLRSFSYSFSIQEIVLSGTVTSIHHSSRRSKQRVLPSKTHLVQRASQFVITGQRGGARHVTILNVRMQRRTTRSAYKIFQPCRFFCFTNFVLYVLG
jgi:hypothetical protein